MFSWKPTQENQNNTSQWRHEFNKSNKSVKIYYANCQACAEAINRSCLEKYEKSTSRPFATSNLVLFMSFAACFLLENICTSQITNGVKQRAGVLQWESNKSQKRNWLLYSYNSGREKALPKSLTFQSEKRNHCQYRGWVALISANKSINGSR